MYQGRIGLVIYGGNYDKMNLEELCAYIKELFEEQKATQRAIALNQSKLAQFEKKVDRILNQHDKRYVEVGYSA